MGLSLNWNIPSAVMVRKQYLTVIADAVRDGIRIRVSRYGQGPDGVLKGYSEHPIVMHQDGVPPNPGIKRRRTPARGWETFHGGGYKQYRKELGLVSDLFVFSNTGAAWKDWGHGGTNPVPNSVISIGFSSGPNNLAADEAENRGRPEMFSASDKELDVAAQLLLDNLVEKIYGA